MFLKPSIHASVRFLVRLVSVSVLCGGYQWGIPPCVHANSVVSMHWGTLHLVKWRVRKLLTSLIAPVIREKIAPCSIPAWKFTDSVRALMNGWLSTAKYTLQFFTHTKSTEHGSFTEAWTGPLRYIGTPSLFQWAPMLFNGFSVRTSVMLGPSYQQR